MNKNDVSIDDLLEMLVRRKISIVVTIGLFALGGFLIGVFRAPIYEAAVVLSPVTDRASGGIGASSLGRVGDLAALAGAVLPAAGSGKDESLAVLRSDLLTAKYIEAESLLPVLYAKKWSAKNKKWNTSDPKKEPTVWQAIRYFKKSVLLVSEDRNTGMVILTIRWSDATLAAKWANGLAALANTYLRDRTIEETERRLSFLNDEVRKTNILELRQAIYALIQQELNTEMLARGGAEYALKVIDPARIPERPTSAGPLLLAGGGGVFGGFLAVLLVVLGRLVSNVPPRAESQRK